MTESSGSIHGDLAFYIKRLRVQRLGQHLDRITRQAAEEDWSYEAFLTALLETEVFARDQTALERRIKKARFPNRSKTLESFDFSYQTSVRKQVMTPLKKG